MRTSCPLFEGDAAEADAPDESELECTAEVADDPAEAAVDAGEVFGLDAFLAGV